MGLFSHGALRTFAALIFSLGFFCAFTPSAQAAPGANVDLTLSVIKVDASIKTIDARLKPKLRKLLKQSYPGKGAKLLDTVTARRQEAKASVELQFKDLKGKAHMIKVGVLEVKPPRVVVQVNIPDYKFNAKSKHQGEGTLAVANSSGIVVAVTPKIHPAKK